MKHIVRIGILTIFLSTTIFMGSLMVKHSTAHACGNSIVSGSTTVANFFLNGKWTTISFSLWFNSCTSQNFGSANIINGSLPANSWTVEVTRLSGPDGGTETLASGGCPSTGICNSPGVFSPTNKAFTFINLSTPDSTIQTSAF